MNLSICSALSKEEQKNCLEALVKTEDTVAFSSLSIEPATIDEIVVFTSKKGDDYE